MSYGFEGSQAAYADLYNGEIDERSDSSEYDADADSVSDASTTTTTSSSTPHEPLSLSSQVRWPSVGSSRGITPVTPNALSADFHHGPAVHSETQLDQETCGLPPDLKVKVEYPPPVMPLDRNPFAFGSQESKFTPEPESNAFDYDPILDSMTDTQQVGCGDFYEPPPQIFGWGRLLPCDCGLKTIHLTEKGHTFGRGDADIPLEVISTERSKSTISRIHCAIKWNGMEGPTSAVRLYNYSINGTYVNNQRLEAGRHIALSDGDRIGFGMHNQVDHVPGEKDFRMHLLFSLTVATTD
ncbi:hypothetical protein EW026_g1407 [Hermanssonia centrifuga]|uniref:FHA domain-containing protein n=1 Tax=Hermanssonia centrifuga TaxID=98765 RepID=A0A4S4KRH6_9APHY|nr:hypothetical protein EW026_g1407 [Hermanssonia centrifuga]